MATYIIVGDCDFGCDDWNPICMKVVADTAQQAMGKVRVAAEVGCLSELLAGEQDKKYCVGDLFCVDMTDLPELDI